jgi:hypothetical protein
LPLGAAQDHKRVGDGDTGPNTGGMGCFSPTSFPPALQDAAMDGIIMPALEEMARRGTPFRGILYAGLMLTGEGVKLLEFNVRFGDPECQALVLRLRSDLLPALQAAYDGELRNFDLRWYDSASIAVVMAARGYPEAPESWPPRPRCAGVTARPSRSSSPRRTIPAARGSATSSTAPTPTESCTPEPPAATTGRWSRRAGECSRWSAPVPT